VAGSKKRTQDPPLQPKGGAPSEFLGIADQERESEDGPPANQAAVTKAGPPAPVNL